MKQYLPLILFFLIGCAQRISQNGTPTNKFDDSMAFDQDLTGDSEVELCTKAVTALLFKNEATHSVQILAYERFLDNHYTIKEIGNKRFVFERK